MKNNYLLGMFAATGMLLATSCSNDELEAAQSGNEAQVTFSLGLENGIGSRAISDGTKADKLVYAVYNADGEALPVFENGAKQKVDAIGDITGKAHEVSITLAKGQTYQVAFWAQNSECDAYKTDDLTKVEVDYTVDNTNNAEVRDAFFKTVEFTVAGNKTIDVVLKRPFAQVNVGVYESDWDAAVASGITIKNSKVVINNAATSINLLTGAVDGSTEVTYDLSAIPNETLEVETDETKAGKEEYKWLSMSYILVADNSTTDEDNDGTLGDARTTLESLNYTFSPVSGNPITFAEGLNSVPVQRNWRTNILGKILTGDIQFNITIDPVYDGDIVYPGASEMEQQLEMAATFGGTVTLTENVTLSAPLNVAADMVIDLDGFTISGNWHKNDGAVIKNSGNLKLIGGTVSSTGNNGGSALQNSGIAIVEGTTLNGAPNADGSWPSYTVNNTGTLTLNGSKITSYHGAVASYGDNAVVTLNDSEIDMTGIQGFTSHGIYTYNNGKVVVNGGTYANKATDQNASGASVINGNVEVNAGNFTGRIENYYGTPVLKGGTYSVKPNKNFVAPGYQAIVYGDKFVVVPEDVTAIAATPEELAAALTADADKINVVLLNNIDLPISSLGQQTGGSGEYKLGGTSTEKITIDLNGKKLNVTTTYWSNLGAKNDDALFTIKNGTMTSSQETGTWNSYDVTFSNCDYVIENVVFEKAIAFDNTGKSVSLKDVTINETHDYYAMWITAAGQNVSINGLTINSDGRGIKIDEQYVGTPAKVTLNIKDATFKTAKKAAIVVKSAAGAEIKASNLNIDEVAADNYHAVWVDEAAAAYADKVIVKDALKAVEGTVAKFDKPSDLAGATIENNSTILLSAGGYNTFPAISAEGVTVICEEGTVFEGNSNLNINGATVVGATFYNPSGDVVNSSSINGTFKDCTFTGANGLRSCYAGETVVFENCVFDGSTYGVHFDGGANDVIFRNCTLSGFNALAAALTMVTFEGCTFVGNGKSGYNGANLWGSAKMINCEFTFDDSTTNEWIDCIGADKTYEFTNCTVNGVAYTNENYSGLGKIFSRNNVSVKINGVDCKL